MHRFGAPMQWKIPVAVSLAVVWVYSRPRRRSRVGFRGRPGPSGGRGRGVARCEAETVGTYPPILSK